MLIFLQQESQRGVKCSSVSGRLTFADRSVARVTRLAGAAVAADHVEAQGVLVAVVLPAEALVVL